MLHLLANADSTDPTDSNLTLVLIAMVTIAAVCLLSAIPIVVARRRRFAQTEGIAALMVLWGLVAAGSIIWYARAEMAFTKEYTLRIMQNYDARDQSDKPAKPWALWGCLEVAYGGAMLWSATARTAQRRGFPVDPAEPAPDQKI